MPIGINNSYSLPQINDNRINQNFQRISSGERINSAADDPAGLAISNRLGTRIDGFTASIRNAGDGVSLTQLAGGALNQVNDNLARVRELSLQAANGTLNNQDRQALQAEADQLLQTSQDILQNTSFNGVNLFANDNDSTFQVGPDVGSNVTVGGRNLLEELNDGGLQSIDISSQAGAQSALSVIDQSQETINERASEFGAVANRFESAIREFQVARENAAAAQSRIRDTDIAEAASSLISEQVRNQTQIAVRAQANAQSQNVLRLLS